MIRVFEPKRLRLAVLASGQGSNCEAIAAAIARRDLEAEIVVIISDQPEAPILYKATKLNIPAYNFIPSSFSNSQQYEMKLISTLIDFKVDLVVLAGYMRLVSSDFLDAFPLKVINIHPSLLPSFRGLHAQRQAIEEGVRYSGCTVHIVDRGMDTGPIIMQAVVPVKQDDDENSLAARIRVKEHEIYWQVIKLFAEGRVYIDNKRVIIADNQEDYYETSANKCFR